MLEPHVLLFDEPLSNLDAKLRRKMREEIRDIQQRLGLSAVYVTHDQEEALAISDKIVVMNRGAIAQQGAPDALYSRPADAFVADFIGSANLIPVRIVARDAAAERATVALADTMFAVMDPEKRNDEVFLVVRPNAVALSTEQGNGYALSGRIEKSVYLGSHREYTISVADTSILVTPSAAAEFEPGDLVYLKLEANRLAIVDRP